MPGLEKIATSRAPIVPQPARFTPAVRYPLLIMPPTDSRSDPIAPADLQDSSWGDLMWAESDSDSEDDADPCCYRPDPRNPAWGTSSAAASSIAPGTTSDFTTTGRAP